jgi:hypothetical protein
MFYCFQEGTLKTEIDVYSAVGRWTKGQFLFRSSYYTGRGVSSSDLNSAMLEGFYQGIKTEVGVQEAANFVKFVDSLNDLSASAFIQAFGSFWHSECKITAFAQGDRDGDRLTGNGDELFAESLALMAGALGGRRASPMEIQAASCRIKQEFLMTHKDERN